MLTIKINLNVPAFREKNKQSIGVTVFEKTKRSVYWSSHNVLFFNGRPVFLLYVGHIENIIFPK